jgi:hypothetical protein
VLQSDCGAAALHLLRRPALWAKSKDRYIAVGQRRSRNHTIYGSSPRRSHHGRTLEAISKIPAEQYDHTPEVDET